MQSAYETCCAHRGRDVITIQPEGYNQPCWQSCPELAEVSQGCTSTSGGLRCYFLLPGVPSSLRWAGCQMVPLLAATGSQCNCEVILLLQGLLRPVDQGFFRSVQPTLFNALPKKDFSPSCTDYPQALRQRAFGGWKCRRGLLPPSSKLQGFGGAILQQLSNLMLIYQNWKSKEEGRGLIL